MYFIITLAYLLIALSEIIPLYKNKQKKELWLYSALMLFSFMISLLLASEVTLPKPADFVEQIVSYLANKPK
jgi:hypothetical protein